MKLFTTASARGLVNYDLNDRTRNNGAKLIVKNFNVSVTYDFYQIKITTYYFLLYEVVSSRIVNLFKFTSISSILQLIDSMVCPTNKNTKHKQMQKQLHHTQINSGTSINPGTAMNTGK